MRIIQQTKKLFKVLPSLMILSFNFIINLRQHIQMILEPKHFNLSNLPLRSFTSLAHKKTIPKWKRESNPSEDGWKRTIAIKNLSLDITEIQQH